MRKQGERKLVGVADTNISNGVRFVLHGSRRRRQLARQRVQALQTAYGLKPRLVALS